MQAIKAQKDFENERKDLPIKHKFNNNLFCNYITHDSGLQT